MLTATTLAAIFSLGGASFQSPPLTEARITEACSAFLGKIGLKSGVTSIRVSMAKGKSGRAWSAIAYRSDSTFSLSGSDDGEVRVFVDNGLRSEFARDSRSGSAQAFRNGTAAKMALKAIVDKLRGSTAVELRDFRFRQNGLGNPPARSQTSLVGAGLHEGLPVLSGSLYGCIVTLDCQTGRVLEVRQQWTLPPSDRVSFKLSKSAAVKMLRKVARTDAEIASVRQAWVMPIGGKRLRAAWHFAMTPSLGSHEHPRSFSIDGETGKLITWN